MMDGKQGFRDRANNIFGALDERGGVEGKWNLAEHQVFEAGRDANYSSDEDREADKRESRMPSNLFFDGAENDEGQRVMPSNAFCRALDAEPEMDANDAVAEGLSYAKRECLPSRKMEVLDDNIFDKLAKEAQERESITALGPSLTPMDIDIAMPTDSPVVREDPEKPDAATRLRMSVIQDISTLGRPKTPPAIESISPRRRSNEGRETPRKVRFGEVTEFSDQPAQVTRQLKEENVETAKEKPVPQSRQNGRKPNRASSYVPDHVKHPENYQVYTLDTPIVVGSGNDGSNFSQQKTEDSNLSNAQAPSDPEQNFSNSQNEPEKAEVQPSNIVFNPDRKRNSDVHMSAAKQNESADRVNQGSVLSLDPELDLEDQAQDVHYDIKESAPDRQFKSNTRRNRNLRSSNKD